MDKSKRREIIDYLRRYSSSLEEDSGIRDSHKSLLKQIIENPALIGIRENVLYAVPEVAIVEKGVKLGCIDLVLIAVSGNQYELYCIEAKTGKHDTGKKRGVDRKKAETQIADANKFFYRHFGVSPRMIRVHCSSMAGHKIEYHESLRPLEHIFDSMGESA